MVDEPFYAHYLQLTGVDHPGRDETLKSMEKDADKVTATTVLGACPKNELFLKNMGHHLLGVDLSFLDQVTNLFLIRSPNRIIASYTKVIENPTMTDIGLADQARILRDIVARGLRPLVIDTGEILKHPEAMMKKLCEALEIPFEPAMLSWEPGARVEDGVWAKYWYDSVHRSDGLKQKVEKDVELNPRYNDLYREAMEYYSELKTFEIK